MHIQPDYSRALRSRVRASERKDETVYQTGAISTNKTFSLGLTPYDDGSNTRSHTFSHRVYMTRLNRDGVNKRGFELDMVVTRSTSVTIP